MRDDNPYSRLRGPQGPIQPMIIEEVVPLLPSVETIVVPTPKSVVKKQQKKSIFLRIKEFFETPRRII